MLDSKVRAANVCPDVYVTACEPAGSMLWIWIHRKNRVPSRLERLLAQALNASEPNLFPTGSRMSSVTELVWKYAASIVPATALAVHVQS